MNDIVMVNNAAKSEKRSDAAISAILMTWRYAYEGGTVIAQPTADVV